MPKKTMALLAVLSMGVGLPGAYFQAIVSWECDNYCFAPGYPTPALLYLWFSLFLIGTGLGFLTWIALLEKQSRHKNWGWGFVTVIAGGASCFGFLGALLGASGKLHTTACILHKKLGIFAVREALRTSYSEKWELENPLVNLEFDSFQLSGECVTILHEPLRTPVQTFCV
jgi:hypothetical protein